MDSLNNRIAIVSAAGRGIGKGIALNLARAGATVIVNSYSRETTENTVDEIIASGGEAKAMPGDITRPELMLEITEQTIQEFGQIDILVNNVGAGSKTPASPAPSRRVPGARFRRVRARFVEFELIVGNRK